MNAPARSPGLSKRLLLPSDQLARMPLRAWSRRLLDRLGSPPTGAASAEDDLAACANNAALILAHAGDTAAARLLCAQQVAWAQRLAAAGCPEALTRTVQPWINLGRLEGMAEGRPQDALERLGALPDYWSAEPTPDAPLVHRAVWSMMERDGRAAADFLALVYVVDSARTLLAAGRYPDVLAFALPRGRDSSPLRRRLGEARVVALALLGRYDEAEDEARSHIAGASARSSLVFYLRRVEVLQSAGREAEARDGADALLGLCLRLPATLGAPPKEEVASLLILARVCHVAAALACHPGRVERLRQRVHEAARRADDLVLQWELVLLGLRTAPPPERDRCAARRDEILAHTAYVRIHRSRPRRPPPEEVSRLYRAVGALLRRRSGHGAERLLRGAAA